MFIGLLMIFTRLNPRPIEYSLTLSFRYRDLYPVLSDRILLRRVISAPAFKKLLLSFGCPESMAQIRPPIFEIDF